jgi:small subunit ribosomal protein S8
MMIDPIADMLTRIRNASKALLPEVVVHHSRIKENIAQILKQEGYLEDCSVEGQVKKSLKLKLKYQGRKGVIEKLRRASRPGLRRYVRSEKIPRVLGGMGTVILSTPQGVMTGTEAQKRNLGGELICYVW